MGSCYASPGIEHRDEPADDVPDEHACQERVHWQVPVHSPWAMHLLPSSHVLAWHEVDVEESPSNQTQSTASLQSQAFMVPSGLTFAMHCGSYPASSAPGDEPQPTRMRDVMMRRMTLFMIPIYHSRIRLTQPVKMPSRACVCDTRLRDSMPLPDD